jgi:ribulose-phosphate 3-epimerase
LARDISLVEDAGARILHIDVMDGHFVPNLTLGLPALESIRKTTDLVLDVHLMITNPDSMAKRYVDAGADWVTVHYEAATHLDQVLAGIREKGAKAGVVLNPETPVFVLEEILPKCEVVLIMSVNPGFGGQEFVPTSFEKVKTLKKMIEARGLDVKTEIDGGISAGNVAEAVHAGVDIIIAGSAIFHSDDPAAMFREMQCLAESAHTKVLSES